MKYIFYFTLSTVLIGSMLGFWYYNETRGELYGGFSAKVIRLQTASVTLSAQPMSDIGERAEVQEEKLITLLFTGDIMLSRGVNGKMVKYDDYAFPFRQTAEFLRSADLTIGNLEGPISDKGRDLKNLYSFRANPNTLSGLVLAGFDILDVNNNHIMDWGAEAFTDTLNNLKDIGVDYSGAGLNYDEANSPIVKDVGGTKIAFLSFSDLSMFYAQAKDDRPGISTLDVERVEGEIKAIKENGTADIVIIMFHWGEEYQVKSNKRQQDIAHRLIDSGADLIVGHHPHVAQEIEQYGSGWAVYSLGNFIFDQHFSEETMEGLVLKATIKDKAVNAIETKKIEISTDFQPFIH